MPEVVARGWFVRHGMSLSAWRSPRSIPTGQDGRRPLQHKLGVTYIYVLKCITHRRPPPPPPDGVAFLLPPASTLLGLASHSATRTPNFIIIISPAWCTYLPTAESEFCKSRTALAPLTIILKRKFERILVNSVCTAVNYPSTFEARFSSIFVMGDVKFSSLHDVMCNLRKSP